MTKTSRILLAASFLAFFGGGGKAYAARKAIILERHAFPLVTSGAPSVSGSSWTWLHPDHIDNTFPVRGYIVLPATGYNLADFDNIGAISGKLPSQSTIFREEGRSTNTTYGRFVAAYNDDIVPVKLALSEEGAFTTAAAPPSTMTITNVHVSSVTILWANNNPAGTSYVLSYWHLGFSTATIKVGKDVFSYNVHHLDPNAKYFFSVQAINKAHALSEFASISTTTMGVFGSTTTFPLLPPDILKLAVKSVYVSSVVWSWAAVPSKYANIAYDVEASSNPGGQVNISTKSASIVLSTNSTTSTVMKYPLLPNAAYGIRLQARNLSARGPLSQWSTAYTLADVAKNFKVDVTSDVHISSMTLFWTATSADYYKLKYYGYDKHGNLLEGRTLTVPGGGSVRHVDLKGLQGDATYFFAIQAINHDGRANPPDWITAWGNSNTSYSTHTHHLVGGLEISSVKHRLSEVKVSVVRHGGNKRKGVLSRPAEITIAPLADNVRVSVIGKGGVLVRQLPVVIEQAFWDQTDDRGRVVKRGTYYLLLEGSEREKRLIKLILR